jgi:hypothetical protein
MPTLRERAAPRVPPFRNPAYWYFVPFTTT